MYKKFLISENINYNVRVNDKLTVSPHLSILGLDSSETYGSPDYQNALLSNGLGLNVKALLAKHLTFCSSLELKHFYVTGRTFNSKNYIGYTIGINIGYIFE